VSSKLSLKAISHVSVAKALEKANTYRLLNEPEQAESICLDILAVEPENQNALVMLILALTDQFPQRSGHARRREAESSVLQLTDEYERIYYTGIIHERHARALLESGVSGPEAYEAFVDAMSWYEKAEAIRPAETDDPLLRYNSCARSILRERLAPRKDTGTLAIE
jgi:hypothetical protein